MRWLLVFHGRRHICRFHQGGQLFSHEILIDGVTIGRYDLSGGSLDAPPRHIQIGVRFEF